MSCQLSPVIYEMISDLNIRNFADKIICIAFDHDVKFNQAFILCNIIISWDFTGGISRDVSEDFGRDLIKFSIHRTNYQKNKLNHLLPELYHPVIKSAESGLP